MRPTARGTGIPEGSRYLVVVENVLVGPRIYSARESNMPIVEELRMEVPGCGNVQCIPARRSARSFCNGCRWLQDECNCTTR